MKLLIIQPKIERSVEQLENELQNNPQVDAVIFPEGYLNDNVEEARALAKRYSVILIGGYRRVHEKPKDRAIMINRQGEIVIDRIKYSDTTFSVLDGLKIGHILCDELIEQGLKSHDKTGIDLIVHPIGVGMFSEEQFEQWIAEAKRIATEYKAMIIGTSHANGSFRNSDVSIPIAYCIGNDGKEIFVSKNDVKPVVVDTGSDTRIANQSLLLPIKRETCLLDVHTSREKGQVQDMGEQDIISLIDSDDWMMHVLQTAQSLGLPDWCVCAGFIRSKVWDHLHGFARTRLADVDVVYFDPNHIDESTEKEYEGVLRRLDSSIPWSVKNQARMHTKNGHAPYTSTADGLSNFPEVCTAIGAYLDTDGQVKLIAPYGVDDLVSLVVRPTSFFTRQDKRGIYEERVATKGWRARWHRLHIVHP